MKKRLTIFVTLIMVLNVSACGYFLYPERVGQNSGKIDPTVVILDAAGLLFGILPGVVAFAVDLSTGAIYLSPGEQSAIEKHSKKLGMIENLNLVPTKKADISLDTDQTAKDLAKLLGHPVNADQINYFKAVDSKSIAMAPLVSKLIL